VAGFGESHVKSIFSDSTVYLIFHVDKIVGMMLLVIRGTRVLVSQILGSLLERLYGFDASFPFLIDGKRK